MAKSPTDLWTISWVLRIGAVMEFVGHGALGWGHPPAWARYFGVVGIGSDVAQKLMPMVGAFDVTLALAILVYPLRGVSFYMAIWGLWTALLRPLSGESIWEAVERAGNYGAVFALFLISGGVAKSLWSSRVQDVSIGEDRLSVVRWVLRLTTSALLLGHGALGLIVRKPLLAGQYSAMGIHYPGFELCVGGFEILLAAAVLIRPGTKLLFLVLIWKLATEALSPISGLPLWVFIEHGGSYAAPLALALITFRRPQTLPAASESVRA